MFIETFIFQYKFNGTEDVNKPIVLWKFNFWRHHELLGSVFCLWLACCCSHIKWSSSPNKDKTRTLSLTTGKDTIRGFCCSKWRVQTLFSICTVLKYTGQDSRQLHVGLHVYPSWSEQNDVNAGVAGFDLRPSKMNQYSPALYW